jgi:hypothetical protein
LAPGESAILTVRFDPSVFGRAEDTLTLLSNSANDPLYTVALKGEALPNAPSARVELVASNNLGGEELGAAPLVSNEVFRITNDGGQPLTLSSFQLSGPNAQFALIGIPADLVTNPIRLNSGESFTFGGSFDATALGLQVSKISIATNDPTAPQLSLSLVGTGIDASPFPDWGNDFVAIKSNSVVRAQSNDLGNFELFLPARTSYETVIFDPATWLVTHNFGNSGASGRGIDLTGSLVFDASNEPDSDFDGLPDDIELAVGTRDAQERHGRRWTRRLRRSVAGTRSARGPLAADRRGECRGDGG